MLIGIDGNEANIVNRVGSNIYAFEILHHLYNTSTKDSFIIYLRNKPLSDLPPERFNWRYKVVGPKKLWTQIALPVHLYFDKPRPSVFFTPGHYAPRFCPVPSVISILDTSYLLFPQYFKKNDLYQLKNWTAYSIKKAKKIIAISYSTKNDIISFYKVNEDKINVIYPGFNQNEFQISKLKGNTQEILSKYKIKKPFILYVGTIQPRKNISRLIEAFTKIYEKNKGIHLVLTGKTGWLFDEVIRKVQSIDINRNICLTGFVADCDLPYLYKEALCFVLPSLYEGFGLPVLESMSMKCPVVVSNISSLPEIVGDFGIKIDPYDTDNIYQGIIKAISFDSEIKNEIIEKAYQRTKLFSWEKCTQEILEVLKEASI